MTALHATPEMMALLTEWFADEAVALKMLDIAHQLAADLPQEVVDAAIGSADYLRGVQRGLALVLSPMAGMTSQQQFNLCALVGFTIPAVLVRRGEHPFPQEIR